MRTLTFEQQGSPTINSPEWSEIESSLQMVDPRTRGYFILFDDSGSYIQAAGARLRMVVEYRIAEKGRPFRHFVVGTPEQDVSKTSINTSAGIVQLHRNEIHSLSTVTKLFKRFYENDDVCGDYVLRDDTKRYEQ